MLAKKEIIATSLFASIVFIPFVVSEVKENRNNRLLANK